MRWPWQKAKEPEKRSYTDTITASFQSAAEGGASTAPLATAALEAATGIYGRCLAAATVRNADRDVIESLSPAVLSQIGRELIRRGESMWRIRTPDGRAALDPVAYSTLTGASPDPMTWGYRLHLYGPTDSVAAHLSARSVLHVRLAFDSSRPWQGIPPWSWASSTGRAVTNLEKLVADEAGSPFGYLLGVPESVGDGEDDDPLGALRGDLGKAKGATLLIEDPGVWDASEAPVQSARRTGFPLLRFGANPPSTLNDLRTAAGRDVLAACGVPPTLFVPNSDGTAQREAFRRFLHASLRPIARLIESEAQKKLDSPDLVIDLSELWAADVAGRARAFGQLVKAGVDPEDAADNTGVQLRRPVRRPRAEADNADSG